MYIYVYVNVYMYIYICILIYICINMYNNVSSSPRVYTFIHIYTNMYVCIHAKQSRRARENLELFGSRAEIKGEIGFETCKSERGFCIGRCPVKVRWRPIKSRWFKV